MLEMFYLAANKLADNYLLKGYSTCTHVDQFSHS